MVHKNQDYFKTSGLTIIEFGKGDVAVCCGKSQTDKEAYILFSNIPAGPIGACTHRIEKDMTADDVKPDAMMVFPKIESIQVVIDVLMEAKEELEKMM